MTINGVKIKKYRARVKDNTGKEEYKIVEGYVSISQVVWDYSKSDTDPLYVPCFVAEEVNFDGLLCSGYGKAVFKPKTYYAFEIVGEVE